MLTVWNTIIPKIYTHEVLTACLLKSSFVRTKLWCLFNVHVLKTGVSEIKAKGIRLGRDLLSTEDSTMSLYSKQKCCRNSSFIKSKSPFLHAIYRRQHMARLGGERGKNHCDRLKILLYAT